MMKAATILLATCLLATCGLALSATAHAKFIAGPLPSFGNAYAVDYPENTNALLTFPASILPGAQGTIEFWGKLTDFPTAISNSGTDFIQISSSPHPTVHYRVGFAANDGCGGTGMHGSVGVATDSFCSGVVDVNYQAGNNTYAGILGDPTAWHHYALVWDETRSAPQRALLFLDGVQVSNRWQDLAPTNFADPANYPSQVFGVIQSNEAQGSIDIDNLILRNTAKLDFSDRFMETPVGNDVVLWNRMGSVSEIEDSAIGPGGTLVPEPSTYVLLIAGLCGTVAVARRRMMPYRQALA
jgi:hypothetical protein